MTAPIIPGLNDAELEALLGAAAEAGARSAGYVLLRLPHEIEQLFQEWLAAHYPDRAKRVMSLVRQMRGGRAYDSRFGVRQRGEGPFAALLTQRFRAACARLGLSPRGQALRTDLFQPPTPQGSTLRLL
jgi:DNA repair photolyase